MYRDKLNEIIKEKGFTVKRLSIESGVSVDTIDRMLDPDRPEKESPRVDTLERVCAPLGVEVWELFYLGNHSLVALNAEILSLKTERDELLAELAATKENAATLQKKADELSSLVVEIVRRHIEDRNDRTV